MTEWIILPKKQPATNFNLKNLGFLGKENDKEVEQLIDEPTNGSGDPDLGQFFLLKWLTDSDYSSWDNGYCLLWHLLPNWALSDFETKMWQRQNFIR